jgi:hypothetical protein
MIQFLLRLLLLLLKYLQMKLAEYYIEIRFFFKFSNRTLKGNTPLIYEISVNYFIKTKKNFLDIKGEIKIDIFLF